MSALFSIPPAFPPTSFAKVSVESNITEDYRYQLVNMVGIWREFGERKLTAQVGKEKRVVTWKVEPLLPEVLLQPGFKDLHGLGLAVEEDCVYLLGGIGDLATWYRHVVQADNLPSLAPHTHW
jgi:hypothetical protein